jgi:hypothetical protein
MPRRMAASAARRIIGQLRPPSARRMRLRGMRAGSVARAARSRRARGRTPRSGRRLNLRSSPRDPANRLCRTGAWRRSNRAGAHARRHWHGAGESRWRAAGSGTMRESGRHAAQWMGIERAGQGHGCSRPRGWCAIGACRRGFRRALFNGNVAVSPQKPRSRSCRDCKFWMALARRAYSRNRGMPCSSRSSMTASS